MNLRDCIAIENSRGDSLLSLIDSWAYNVQRLVEELKGPGDLREHWGIFDLVAAYYLRDSIEVLTQNEPPSAVTAIDGLLRSSFAEREFDWLNKTSQHPGEGWWWGWLPPRGPLWKEVNEWDQSS